MTTLTCSLATIIRDAPRNSSRPSDEVGPALREAITATQRRIDLALHAGAKFPAKLKNVPNTAIAD